MTKSKTLVAALALAATFTAVTGQAQAHSHWGHRSWGLGAGIVAGTLIGAAATSNYYYAPACRYVPAYDRWGNLRAVKVCDVAPY
jgi:uncharacterized membrane protein YfcA